MSSGKQSAPSKFGGIFQKKHEEGNVDDPAVTKRKKHKRQPAVSLKKDWSLGTEVDGEQGASETKVPSKKDKPRNIRRKLRFGKLKYHEKHKLKSSGKGMVQEETAMDSDAEPKRSMVIFETALLETAEWSEREDERSGHSGRPEGEEKKALFPQIAEAALPDQVSDIASKIEESAAILSPEASSDATTLKIQIPNPEGYIAVVEEKISPIQELVDRARDGVISSKFQWQISLHAVFDFSFDKLIGFWSFFVSRASDATKEVLLRFISPLIKRYPHCFKKALQDKVQTTQAEESVANEE